MHIVKLRFKTNVKKSVWEFDHKNYLQIARLEGQIEQAKIVKKYQRPSQKWYEVDQGGRVRNNARVRRECAL